MLGGITGANRQGEAAQKAGQLGYQASQQGIDWQKQMFGQLQQNLQPYMEAGQTGLAGLTSMQPFNFNANDVENTPGYQFALQQGLKALNNQNSAQGLGLSGAQQKGLMQYATGLANQTYGDQYNRALQSYQTNYNRLSGLASLGQNAAAGVSNAGMSSASNIANLLGQGATALGSGGIGAANAHASILPSIANMAQAGAGIYGMM